MADLLNENKDKVELASLDLSMVEDLNNNLVFKYFLQGIHNRIEYNKNHLFVGDVEHIGLDYDDKKTGMVYRSDEGLRGGLIELIYVTLFTSCIKEDIKLIQEQKEKDGKDK